MTTTIEIDDDTDIDTLTTLMEAKTGEDYLPAEAIRAAVAYWLANHDVTETDGSDDSSHPSIPPRINHGPDTRIGDVGVGGGDTAIFNERGGSLSQNATDKPGRHDFEL